MPVAGVLVVVLAQWGLAFASVPTTGDPLADDRIHARLWRDRVLPIELRDPFVDDVPSHVAVVDADSGRLIGHFPGPSSSFGFPLAWRPVGPRGLDMDYAETPTW